MYPKKLVILVFAFVFISTNEFAFEVIPKDDDNKIIFNSDEIEKIRIFTNTRPTIEISILRKYIVGLEKFTKKNIGKKLSIYVDDNYLYSGTIFESINDGIISFSVASDSEIKRIVKVIGKVPEYINDYEKEYEDDPVVYNLQKEGIWIEKSIEAELEGDYVKAEEYIKKVLAVNPNEPLHYARLGALYFIQGKKRMALEKYIEAEKLIVEDYIDRYPGIYLSLGELYSEFDMYDSAIKSYQKLLLADFYNFNAHLGIAKAFEAIGAIELAIREYEILSTSKDDYFMNIGKDNTGRLKRKIQR